MPSFSATPATIEWTGGAASFIPARFSASPGAVHWTGGSVTFSISAGVTTSVTVPNLDRLTPYDKFPGVDEAAWHRFVAIWQDMCEKIEEAFTGLSSDVSDLTAIVNRLAAAENLAAAANDNATEAVDHIGIAESYTNPTSVGTYGNDGSVTIAAHSRVYGGGTSVSVDGGSVSGFSAGDYVTVYYVDAAREGGAVTYQGTTSAVSQTGSTHIVAQGTVPAAGEVSSSGTSPSAPGYTPPPAIKDYVEP